ncbi:transposase [Cryobacterium sp. CAN_C3]|uniref:hypothetical protein n=1 Tax=unclassified Cryobacterium TaxID=2649013 RepID=UPI001A2CE7A2|nr:transposase [Cryobacterium sp. CAN_C3]
MPISTARTLLAPQGDLSNYTNLLDEPPDHAIGRSRGGLTAQIQALCDAKMRPLALLLGPGQGGDSPLFPEVMGSLEVPRVGGGRPSGLDKEADRRRNVIYGCFAAFKQWRSSETRYDKLALTYRGGVVLRAITIWLKALLAQSVRRHALGGRRPAVKMRVDVVIRGALSCHEA